MSRPVLEVAISVSRHSKKFLVEIPMKLITRFVRDEQGQDLVEYALIVAAVGLALITTVNQLSQGIVSLYSSITGDLASIGTTAQ